MRNVNVAIIEDNEQARSTLARRIAGLDEHAHVSEYSSAERFLRRPIETDIAFMDVALENMDGIAAARKLREVNPQCIVIFISGLRDRVFDALDVHPFHYLVKPVKDTDLTRVYAEAVQAVRRKEGKEAMLRVHTREGDLLVNTKDILYIESRSRKVIIHAWDAVYEMYAAIGVLEEELGLSYFRCHRGYLVNMDNIKSYTRDTIEMQNGDTVYMSRKKYAQFVQAYMWFMQEKHAIV